MQVASSLEEEHQLRLKLINQQIANDQSLFETEAQIKELEKKRSSLEIKMLKMEINIMKRKHPDLSDNDSSNESSFI